MHTHKEELSCSEAEIKLADNVATVALLGAACRSFVGARYGSQCPAGNCWQCSQTETCCCQVIAAARSVTIVAVVADDEVMHF